MGKEKKKQITGWEKDRIIILNIQIIKYLKLCITIYINRYYEKKIEFAGLFLHASHLIRKVYSYQNFYKSNPEASGKNKKNSFRKVNLDYF